MNSLMNKVKTLVFASFLLVAVTSLAKADLTAGAAGWYFTHAGSSGSIFTGAGELGAIYLSSGTTNGIDWGVAIDSAGTTSLSSSITGQAAQRVTPSLVFQSSATANITSVATGTASYGYPFPQMYNFTDGAGRGVRVQNGLYWFPSADASGEARRAIIKWRRSQP